MSKYDSRLLAACAVFFLVLTGSAFMQVGQSPGVTGGVSTGGSGTVSANSGNVGAIADYAAAGGSTTVGPDTLLTDNATSLTYTGTGGIAVNQGTNAGASSTPGLSNTVTWNNASIAGPAFSIAVTNTASTATAVLAQYSAGVAGSTIEWLVDKGGASQQQGNIRGISSSVFGFNSGALNTAPDTGISRSGADVVALGNGAAADTTARVKAAAYMSVGTTFTGNNGCTETSLTGGATAGKFTATGQTSCTIVITMGNAATAPNGWACTALDLTTLADVTNPHQTATTTTTATIVTGTIVAADVIQFSCIGY